RAPASARCPARLAQGEAGGRTRPGKPVPAERCGADAASRVERRAIVSESRVRVSDETEEVPAKDGEVGEADVFGEFDEPEESGETGDAGPADSAMPGAAPSANGAEPAVDGAGEPDPVALFTAELRQLPGEWYVVHSYAGYENRVKANLESRTQSLNME